MTRTLARTRTLGGQGGSGGPPPVAGFNPDPQWLTDFSVLPTSDPGDGSPWLDLGVGASVNGSGQLELDSDLVDAVATLRLGAIQPYKAKIIFDTSTATIRAQQQMRLAYIKDGGDDQAVGLLHRTTSTGTTWQIRTEHINNGGAPVQLTGPGMDMPDGQDTSLLVCVIPSDEADKVFLQADAREVADATNQTAKSTVADQFAGWNHEADPLAQFDLEFRARPGVTNLGQSVFTIKALWLAYSGDFPAV